MPTLQFSISLLFFLIAISVQTLPDHPCGPILRDRPTTSVPTTYPPGMKFCNRTFHGYAPTPSRADPDGPMGKGDNLYGTYYMDGSTTPWPECYTNCINTPYCAFSYYNSVGFEGRPFCSYYTKFIKQDFIEGAANDVVFIKSYLTDDDCALDIGSLVKSEELQYYPEGGVFKLTPTEGTGFRYAGNSPDGETTLI